MWRPPRSARASARSLRSIKWRRFPSRCSPCRATTASPRRGHSWTGSTSATCAATQRRNPLLRLELHPADADHPAIRRSWQRLLETHLAERRARTLADVADALRLATDWDRMGTGAELDDDEHEGGGEPADRRAN